MRKLYIRKCDVCGSGMSRGYVLGSGDTLICDRYDRCYQSNLVTDALYHADNGSFVEAEDKVEWIEEVNDQLYVGWTPDEAWEFLYTEEGMVVKEEEVEFGVDILVYSEEDDNEPYDWVMKETLITDDLEELLA
tara:strand:+ start:525 stop:926 length:402 start_codon:yes stop_codon:yes gene_type:complete